MPHSSGGGSHSGGSHSGSHHSSHSHGGSGRSSRHVRSTYFPDARRYVYYDHHRPVYVYADYDITEKRSPLRFLMLLFYLPFILFTFSMFAEAYHHPHKLPQNYDYKIVVEDKANVLGNTAELRNSLVAFYNRTGISPAVITVENSDWQGNYSDLENYAYDLYVNHFADESHWLIVYSTPDGYSSSDGFEDWYWEGMQGNDTDDVLTKSVTNSFNDELQNNPQIRVVTFEGKFNYSKINNFGVSLATGDYVLLLNNDTQVITINWMEELLMYAQRPDVGAVGGKLYYGDKTIQHAGVVIGLGAHRTAGHVHYRQKRENLGYMGRLCYAQDMTAVTGACLLVKKSLYEQVGGLDESFEISLNDVDFCLKLRKAGYLNVFTPFAELYHFESISRGLDDQGEKAKRYNEESERFRNKWKAELEAGDPYFNPNFSLDKSDFSLRV